MSRAVCRNLTFRGTIDLCRQNEIALGQTVNLMGPGGDLGLAPGQQNVGMVPFLLSDITDAIHEGQRLVEIGEAKFAMQVMLVRNVPLRNLLVKCLQLCALQGGYFSAAGDAFLVSKMFGHEFLPNGKRSGKAVSHSG